ncbi:hypothetical protein VPH35_068256 [Triticum aestivum]
MLAWRSLLSRSHPLLSGLRPAHRHASHPAAVLGGKNLIGSREYASNWDGDSQGRAAAAAATTKRHLYLVLDDHKDGYGIHKLDLADDDGLDGRARGLPEPPVLRVGLPTIGDRAQFAAVGSSIVAICTSPTIDPWGKLDDEFGGVLIYDTNTAVQVVSPQLPKTLLLAGGYEAAIAVGSRLYIFESNGSERYYKYVGGCASGLHCLTNDGGDGSGGAGGEFWGWRPLSPSSSRWCWSWKENLLMLPFHAENITAHAVHAQPGAVPHDYEILVSDRNANMTFSFSTTRHEWTERGDWQLPVVGHAHYHGDLDAWLRLHAVRTDVDEYLCLGNVASTPSEWKVGREKLFCLDEDTAAGWSYLDAKLMPMASHEGRSEYCLMERLRAPKGEGEKKCLGNGGTCLLRLTFFCVERDEDGEPVAKVRRRARSYYLSRYNENFDAQVFWM